MAPRVIAELMSFINDAPNERRVFFGFAADNKKQGLGIMRGKDVKQSWSAFRMRPIIKRQHAVRLSSVPHRSRHQPIMNAAHLGKAGGGVNTAKGCGTTSRDNEAHVSCLL